ncbi:hypothetical protein JCM10908_002836 [Rhodotorula pacifica]|uniref:uncharacterized protein n=1 Tax=Rhodotorula pacifica TaxID=1495444 RepID=UPI00317AC8BB
MAVEGKPLRVYTHLPTASSGSAASLPNAASPTSPTSDRWTTKATRFALAKKRWLAIASVYAVLVVVAWTRGWQPREWLRRQSSAALGGSIRLKPGERVVFDAYGQPHFYPLRKAAADKANGSAIPVTSTKGTTSLGAEADDVYHLSDPSPALYLHTLEQFLLKHFPAADSDESNSDSLLSVLRSFFPSPADPPYNATIPHRIYMTAANQNDFFDKEAKTRLWAEKNNGWTIRKQDDQQADAWVRKRFALHSADLAQQDRGQSAGVVAAWDRLAEPAVLRSDFWRYLVLAVDGGVYADTDVECLRPIERWGEDPDWRGLRVVETALEDPDAASRSVMERTGPGPFTDAVLSYLRVQYQKPWGDLRGLNGNGYRFRASRDAPELLRASRYGGARPERWGDTKVLSITGFSPGVGHMGAQDVNDPAAMAQHGFAGSWRSQKGADI